MPKEQSHIDEIMEELKHKHNLDYKIEIDGDYIDNVRGKELLEDFRTALEKVAEENHNHKNSLCPNCVRITREADIAAVENISGANGPIFRAGKMSQCEWIPKDEILAALKNALPQEK